MTRFVSLGAVRLPLLAAAVLALLSVPALSQVVEKGRTFSDLTATHPCSSAYTDRIARVTDCDAADDIGNGEGAYQCWATCDGTAPWEAVAIGGGGAGVSGLSTADGGTALADNAIVRGDGATGIQGSAVTIADTTGDLQWEGTTADAFEGNFAFTDPTADWTWTWSGTGGVSGVTSITGGISGSSTLPLDGDSSVAGAATVGPAGTITIPETASGTYGFTFDGLSTVGIQAYNSGNLALGSAGNKYIVFRNGATGLALLDTTGFVMLSSGQYKWDTFGGVGNTGLARVSNGVVSVTDASTGVRGLLGGGAAVASATALPVPTGRIFHVTGTTTITSITSTNFQSGVCVTLVFDAALTFTDGSNLKINGDFVTTADDTWSGCYDGTNWYETSRSVN